MNLKIETAKELESLYRQQAQNMAELARSLEIQAFLPDAFAHGACRIGGVSSRSFAGAEVHFTLGDGEKRVFPASQVPRSLWPASMQELFPEKPNHANRKTRQP